MKDIEEMLEHLALAHGGHSQYDLQDVGRAIAGNVCNQGWTLDLEDLACSAAGTINERWNDDQETEDSLEILHHLRMALEERGLVNQPNQMKIWLRIDDIVGLPFNGCVGACVGFEGPTSNTGWWVWLDVGQAQPRGYPAELLTQLEN